MSKIHLKKHLFLCFVICFYFCSTNSVLAQSYGTVEGDSINPRLYLTMGYYSPKLNTSIKINGKFGPGAEIGLEDLGLDETKSVFKLDGIIRVSPKSQVAVTYMSINRNSSATLEKDITVGDTIFYEGSGIGLKFNIDYFSATWRYSFFNEKNWNAGVSVGARAVSIDTGLEAKLNADSYAVNESVLAPAILFGVHGSAYLTPKLLARYSLEYFYLSVDGLDINVIESNASVQYFFLKKFGAGLAYSTNDYQVNDIPLSGDFNGTVDFNFGGFNLFLTARL